MTKITLLGEPKSTNHIYKINCAGGFPRMYMSAEGKEIKERYQWEAKSQFKKKLIEDEISLDVWLWFKTLRKHDIDNYNKILFDSLTGTIWKDDSQIQELIVHKMIDKENPRIEITIL